MKYRSKMTRKSNRRSFRKGLRTRKRNYDSGYVKRGGMRF